MRRSSQIMQEKVFFVVMTSSMISRRDLKIVPYIHVQERLAPGARCKGRISSINANIVIVFLGFTCLKKISIDKTFQDDTLQWRHNGRDSVSNHQPYDCLLNCLFRRRWKKTSKLRVTCLCAGNSPGTGKFPAQMASNAENVSIWWRHLGSIKMKQNLIHRK